jgi:uncharacterized membrane protein YhhN
MPIIFLFLAILSALIEWMAIYKNWRKVEYFAKPGVMVFLLAWLVLTGELSGLVVWFGIGILLSLVGDIFLLNPNEQRWFLFGLGAFLLAHIAYIIGFNSPPPPFNGITFVVALIVVMSALPLVRRILLGAAQMGLRRLILPVRIYAAAISLMLFSALITLFRIDWLSIPAYLVSIGAILFITSDIVLAWNKFVKPIRRGRLILMITYHLGQFALIAGAVGQFGK